MLHCWLHHGVLGLVGDYQAAPKEVCAQGEAHRAAVLSRRRLRRGRRRYDIITVETIGPSVVGKVCSAGTSLRGGVHSRRRVRRHMLQEVCEEVCMQWGAMRQGLIDRPVGLRLRARARHRCGKPHKNRERGLCPMALPCLPRQAGQGRQWGLAGVNWTANAPLQQGSVSCFCTDYQLPPRGRRAKWRY